MGSSPSDTMPKLQSLTFYGEGVWGDSGHSTPDDLFLRRLNALGGFTRYVFAHRSVQELHLHAWRAKPVVSVFQGMGESGRWRTHYVWSKSDLHVPHLDVTIPRDLLRTHDLEQWFDISVKCLGMLLSAMDSYSEEEIGRVAEVIQGVGRDMDYEMLERRAWASGAELEVKADILGNQVCSVRLPGGAEMTPVDLAQLGGRDWALLNKLEIGETLKSARFNRSQGVFEIAVPYYTPLREWLDITVDGYTGRATVAH